MFSGKSVIIFYLWQNHLLKFQCCEIWIYVFLLASPLSRNCNNYIFILRCSQSLLKLLLQLYFLYKNYLKFLILRFCYLFSDPSPYCSKVIIDTPHPVLRVQWWFSTRRLVMRRFIISIANSYQKAMQAKSITYSDIMYL